MNNKRHELRVGILMTFGLLAWLACAFFTFYGVQLVYAALTFDGEGSLGHVGMYIGAMLFPLLALLTGGIGFFATRAARRSPWGGRGTHG